MDLGSTIGFLLIRMQKRIMKTIFKWFSHGSGMCLKVFVNILNYFFFLCFRVSWIKDSYCSCPCLNIFNAKMYKLFWNIFFHTHDFLIETQKYFARDAKINFQWRTYIKYWVFIDFLLLNIYLAKWIYFEEPLSWSQ